MNPRDRLRSASRRWTDPAEALAQQVTESILDLVLSSVDINEIVGRIDLNALLARTDLNAILAKADLNALLDRVDANAFLARVELEPLLDQLDVNDLVSHVDVDALVERTDLGALIARSTGGMGAEALDAARSQAVGLDQFVDRWVQRLLRRKHPGPSGPPVLVPVQAEP